MSALNETLLRQAPRPIRDRVLSLSLSGSLSTVLLILTGCKHLIDLRGIFHHTFLGNPFFLIQAVHDYVLTSLLGELRHTHTHRGKKLKRLVSVYSCKATGKLMISRHTG